MLHHLGALVVRCHKLWQWNTTPTPLLSACLLLCSKSYLVVIKDSADGKAFVDVAGWTEAAPNEFTRAELASLASTVNGVTTYTLPTAITNAAAVSKTYKVTITAVSTKLGDSAPAVSANTKIAPLVKPTKPAGMTIAKGQSPDPTDLLITFTTDAQATL